MNSMSIRKELYAIAAPGQGVPELRGFFDRARYVLSAMADAEKPPERMLSRWIFEKLKGHQRKTKEIREKRRTPKRNQRQTKEKYSLAQTIACK